MSDTITVDIDSNWRHFFPDLGDFFTFSNEGPETIYVRESLVEPSPNDRGFVYASGERGSGQVEHSFFWVRTRAGKSSFHYSGDDTVGFSGLTLWLDAADINTIAAPDGMVDSWRDKSGNGHNAEQTGFARPDASGNTMNGNNTITFDGNDDFLDIPFAVSLNPDAFTIFIVCRVTGGVGNFRSIVSVRSVSSRGYFLRAHNNNQWIFFIGNGSSFQPVGGDAIILNTSTMVTFECINGSQNLFLNQELSDSDSLSFAANTGSPTRIGAGGTDSITASEFTPVDIGEILLYDRILLNSEKDAVHSYLSNKWNLPFGIPS